METGQKLIVSIPSNPTTGYDWAVAAGLANGGLELVGSAFERNPEAGRMMGAGGKTKLTFVAKAMGRYELSLAYRRPWEAVSSNEQQIVLDIVVTEHFATH